jgi:hypothetical protein
MILACTLYTILGTQDLPCPLAWEKFNELLQAQAICYITDNNKKITVSCNDSEAVIKKTKGTKND